MTMKRTLAACAILIVLAAVGGCASSKTTTGWQRPVLGDIPPFTAAATLPFDAYRLSDAELEQMQRAQAELLSECALDYGVQVTFSGDYMPPADDARLIWGGRIGTMDIAQAAQFGYHPAPGGSWAPVGGIYVRDPANLQPDAVPGNPQADAVNELVVYGPTNDEHTDGEQDVAATATSGQLVPAGGCWKLVESEVATPLTSDLDLAVETYNLALVDGRVQDAIRDWSACMVEKGYEFDEVQGPSRSFTLAELTPEETRVAIADVECTDASKWADVFYAVVADYQRQAVEKNPMLFDAVLASQKARLAALTTRVN